MMPHHRFPATATMVLCTAVVAFAVACKKSNAIPEATASEAASPSASANTNQHLVKIDTALVEAGRVQTKPVERRSLADEVAASGEVVPAVDGEAEVGALVSGRVASVLAKEGDKVKVGQILAWVDAPEAARMQGDWLRAKAQLWRANKMVEQERALWADKATSERSLQAAEAELRNAVASERAAYSLLVASHVPVPKEGGNAASRIAVSSPITGVVSKRTAVVGGHVTSEMSLFEVVAPEKLLVRANVPEVVAKRVEIGGAAIVRMRGGEQTCPGTVQARLDRIDETKRTMGVMVATNAGCTTLVAGAFVDVTVRLTSSGGAPTIVVPRTSIVEFDGAPAVFVENKSLGQGQYEIHAVRLGHSDGAHVIVEEGLKDGDPVVVVGALLLKGEHIRKDLGGE